MIAMLAWWAVLWLPGHAIARRLSLDDGRGGALAHVALGYLYSFALFTPVSVMGYALGWPIAALTVAVLLATVAGAVDLARTRFWQHPRTWSWLDVAWLAALVVIVDVAFGARAGGLTGGDARFHVARVRMLLDHGFNNWEPYFADHPFSRVYHTNLYHALIAAGAQLTGALAIEAWVWTLPWAKLVGAAGVGLLARRVLDSRLAAWLAGAAWCVAHAPITFALYPNHVAPWLVAVGLASLASRPQAVRVPPFELACCFIALAQVHALYGIALALAVGPWLAWRFVAALRARNAWRSALWAVLTPMLLAPFLLATQYAGREASKRSADATVATDDDAAQAVDAISAQDDSDDDEPPQAGNDDGDEGGDEVDGSSGKWKRMASRDAWLLAALLLGLASPQRRRLVPLAAASITMLLMLDVPPVSGWLAEVLGGRAWAVRRMGIVLRVASFAVMPGVLLAFARSERMRQLATGVLLVLCTAWWLRAGWRPSSFWGLPRYMEASAYANRALTSARKKTAFLARTIPRGSTVLANGNLARHLVGLHDCYVIAVENPSPGIPRSSERLRELATALDPKASWNAKRTILKRHRIHYLVTRRNYTQPRYASYLKVAGAGVRSGGLTVIDLREL